MNRLSHDPYEILCLPQGATEKQIKRAYRRLAKKLHPDRNPKDPECEERFKKLQWAYETLIGRNKQEWLPPKPFSGTTHPFHGFFQAVRAYYGERKRTKQTFSQRGKGNAGSNFTADH